MATLLCFTYSLSNGVAFFEAFPELLWKIDSFGFSLIKGVVI